MNSEQKVNAHLEKMMNLKALSKFSVKCMVVILNQHSEMP